jgi:hypothetical protein
LPAALAALLSAVEVFPYRCIHPLAGQQLPSIAGGAAVKRACEKHLHPGRSGTPDQVPDAATALKETDHGDVVFRDFGGVTFRNIMAHKCDKCHKKQAFPVFS